MINPSHDFNVQYGVSLADYNTWRIGGAAQCVFFPQNFQDIHNFLYRLSENSFSNTYKINKKNIRFLGLGSNVLIPDEGIEGIVVMTRSGLNQMTVLSANDAVVRLEAGVPCGTAARFCARSELQGLEFLAGVPGTMGGALAMNAGACGHAVWEYVTHCETIDAEGIVRLRPASDYKASYRHVEKPEGEWFLAAYLKLMSGSSCDSFARIKALLAHRAHTQPIDWPSCGSVFRNPNPYYAARLIEDCGLKGLREGDAVVSEKHANFIVNQGSALASDIKTLMQTVQETVRKKFAIDLTPEVHVFK